jgi:hypothetical protein
MKNLVRLILVVTSLNGCSKNSDQLKDTVPPVITINTPFDGEIFTAGQPINITGSITDNNYIAEVHIHVSNLNNGNLLMDVHLYPAAATTTFSQPITAVSGIDYKIQIIAKDRAVNQTTSSVEVICN